VSKHAFLSCCYQPENICLPAHPKRTEDKPRKATDKTDDKKGEDKKDAPKKKKPVKKSSSFACYYLAASQTLWLL